MTVSKQTIFDTPSPRFFSISAGEPFLSELAHGLTNALGSDPLSLADTEIFLPTRRAGRALADVFAATAGENTAIFPPRIRTLGDIDAAELDALDDAASELTLPPAVSPQERVLILAQMVAARDTAFAGQRNWQAALLAARELGQLLDSLYTEEIDTDAIKDAAPPEHAAHWDISLKFLDIVLQAWPAYLAERGRLDPAIRRVQLIRTLTARWHDTPPTTPVIIAGSTGSAPSVADLMGLVASLPKGAVILPGFDKTMDPRAWARIDDPHPQAGLKALLTRLYLKPDDIETWPGHPSEKASTARRDLLSLALRPAEATDDWRQLTLAAQERDPELKNSTHGLELIEAQTEELEAASIAIRFRETLEIPGRTAMLVTPDRNLARRVAAKMKRWNVHVDDSSGAPFAASRLGVFLNLVAEAMCAPGDTVKLLALLRHPNSLFGLAHDAYQSARDTLDRSFRGAQPVGNWADIADTMLREGEMREGAMRQDKLREADRSNIRTILTVMHEATHDLPDNATPTQFLTRHLTLATHIATGNTPDTDRPLWAGEDGEAGAKIVGDLLEDLAAANAMVLPHRDYPAAFAALVASSVTRRRSAAHPRLSILGPLEARLQHADHIILAGLNDGVWPGDPPTDPFLSRAMRANVGLPSPERRTGLAAHDFAQLAASPSVLLTRSKRSGDSPSIPSRWLVRLKNILTSAQGDIDVTAKYTSWAKQLDTPDKVEPSARPAPRPPLDARPRKMSVTRIEKWLRDPYSVFARDILKLYKADDPGGTFSLRELGQLLHAIYEDAAKLDKTATTDDLHELLAQHRRAYRCQDADLTLWAPAFAASFEWFCAFDAERRRQGTPAILEGSGEIDAPGVAQPFKIRGRADRIDLDTDGGVTLIDYKTSIGGTHAQAKYFNPQLQLLGLIARQGGFPDIGPREINSYQFVRMLNYKKSGMAIDDKSGDEANIAIDDAAEKLAALINAFDDIACGYPSQPHPAFTDNYGDYDTLARRGEWNAGNGEDDT